MIIQEFKFGMIFYEDAIVGPSLALLNLCASEGSPSEPIFHIKMETPIPAAMMPMITAMEMMMASIQDHDG
jgi:hypothetical protein